MTADVNERAATLRTAVGLTFLLGTALGLRLWGVGDPIWYDEGFHILAARSWLENGTFCIADCLLPYERGAIYTLLVAASLALFGESPEAARLPSILSGVLLVAAVFYWVRREISERAAWVAAALCAVGPELIAWSQTARFYAPQALLIWCAAALFYSGVAMRDRRLRAAAVTGSLACFFVSLQLQISTLIPAAAVGLWFVGWLGSRRSRLSRRNQLVIGGAALLLAAALTITLWPTLGELWRQYRGDANLMAAEDVDNVFFYHAWFSGMYSFLYALFPVAVVTALAIRPRPALFLTVVFTASFIAHSFGGFKGDRLILYTFPFFFTIWGVTLAEVVPRLMSYSRRALEALVGWLGSWTLRLGAVIAVSAAVLFAAMNIEALQTTVRLLTVPNAEWSFEPYYRGRVDWEAVRPSVEPLMDDADIVVSSAHIKTIYYFDRNDVSLSANQLFDSGGGPRGSFHGEFWPNYRTGNPVVSSPESVERIVSCYRSGLFLIERGHWRRAAAVPPQTADVIEALTERIDLPSEPKALVFAWSGDGDPGSDCTGGVGEWYEAR